MSRKEMAGVLDLVPDIRRHKGTILGMLDKQVVCIPEDTPFNSNIAVYGASGSKKTRAYCINRILQSAARGESLVCSDPKSELYEKTSDTCAARAMSSRYSTSFCRRTPTHGIVWLRSRGMN